MDKVVDWIKNISWKWLLVKKEEGPCLFYEWLLNLFYFLVKLVFLFLLFLFPCVSRGEQIRVNPNLSDQSDVSLHIWFGLKWVTGWSLNFTGCCTYVWFGSVCLFEIVGTRTKLSYPNMLATLLCIWLQLFNFYFTLITLVQSSFLLTCHTHMWELVSYYIHV